MRHVGFRVFKTMTKSWAELFSEAARFADEVGRERLISISHSEDSNEGVVAVWFWE